MKFARSLSALVFFSSTILHAATFTVINSNDSGAGSLRQALADAAAAGGADTVNFAAGLSGQTITLTSGPLATADSNGVTVDASSLPGGITISGNNTARVFENTGFGSLTLTALTITGGFQPSGNGGGAIFNSATLLADRCTFTGNTGGFGAVIYSTGTLTAVFQQSTLSGNTATTTGGAIYNLGTMILTFQHRGGEYVARRHGRGRQCGRWTSNDPEQHCRRKYGRDHGAGLYE